MKVPPNDFYTIYIQAYPLSGNYFEALFFIVDFGVIPIGTTAMATLKIFDADQFRNTYDPEYNT